jgi:circadian clock protein KaiC
VDTIARTGATRVVIDSLSEIGLYLAPEFRHDLRLSVFRTLARLAEQGVSVLVTAGFEDNQPGLRFSLENLSFLADAVLSMRFAEVEGHLCKFLTVVKVRGIAHSNELRGFRITDAGMEIDARKTVYDQVLTGYPTMRTPRA